MTTITITHEAAEGTLVEGDPRPHHQLCKTAGFRWSRNIGADGAWYLPHSRDKAPRTELIERLAGQLRDVGFDVNITIRRETRTTAEVEADRQDRLASRADRLDERADRRGAEADARFATVREIADAIPFGQPILVGHHSERRHRRDVDRIETGMGKAVAASRESDDARRRAAASRASTDARYSAGQTSRRIDKLEADLRDIARKLLPCATSGRKMKPEAEGRLVECPVCYHDVTIGADLLLPEHKAPSPEWREQLLARQADIEEQVAYWKAHLADLEAAGVKLWGPADFRKGDIVNGDDVVVRVNPKTLTVQSRHVSWTLKLKYSEVRSMQRPGTEATA